MGLANGLYKVCSVRPMVLTMVWLKICSMGPIVWTKSLHSSQWWSMSVWFDQGWPKPARSGQYPSLGMMYSRSPNETSRCFSFSFISLFQMSVPDDSHLTTKMCFHCVAVNFCAKRTFHVDNRDKNFTSSKSQFSNFSINNVKSNLKISFVSNALLDKNSLLFFS